jgi:parallel beta-helix repeat protein
MNNRFTSIVTVCLLVIGGFFYLITFEPDVVNAITIYVGSGAGNDTTSIQDAIDNYSNPGDIVYVYSGTYYENVVVNKTITLTGEDKVTTVVDGGGSGDVVNITADWVNVSGLTIRNSGSEASWPDFDVGIKLYMAQNCSVINNNVSSNNGSGIFLYSSSNNNISDNTVSSNIYGIILYSSSFVIISNNVIHGNGYGIALSSSSFVNVQENEVFNNSGDGIVSQYSSDNSFINNRVHDHSRSGIFFSGKPYYNNKIIGNVIYKNGYDGIHLETGTTSTVNFWNNSIINNTVYNNTNRGISFSLGENNFVIDNIVHHNGLGSINPMGGISLASSRNNVIMGNTVHDNDHGIIADLIWSNYPSKNNTFIENSISNNDINVYISEQSTVNNFINCSLSNAGKYDFNLTEDSHATTLNTTFDGEKVWIDSTSTLTVKNYLHVLVLNAKGLPIALADINVTDNGIPIYKTLGYGGSDLQTGGDGFVRWILVTDRIYNGNSSATENITVAEVSSPLKTFFNNPRYVNMNRSHIEIFIEIGGIPDLALTADDIVFNPQSPVEDTTLVTINVTVHNIGLGNASNIVVRFFDGIPPGNMIGDDQISSIGPLGDVGWAEVEWSASPVGVHEIHVIVDPDYIIPESNETNNNASKVIEVINLSINLEPGWNLISLPRIQTDPALNTVLNSIEGDYDAVQWFNTTDSKDQWKHHHISKPQHLNDLEEINHSIGFWIHVTNPNGTTLLVYGDVFSSPEDIPLYIGWNMVGFPSLSNKNRASGLNNLDFGTEVDAIWTFDAATQTWEEVGSSDSFILEKGYWVHATQECVWNVPL